MRKAFSFLPWLVWLAWDLAAPVSAGTIEDSACRLAVLEDLGWRIESGPGAQLVTKPGSVCERADFADARSQGELVLRMPRDSQRWLEDPASSGQLDAIINSRDSTCAFAIKLGQATRRAVDRLVANPGFKFSSVQAGWIGFGAGSAGDAGWQATRSWGRAFIPEQSNSRAISAFYERPVRAECGTGRQVAQYAMLHELFGSAGFDRAFAGPEIVVGTFVALGQSRSVLLGSQRGEMFADGLAVKSSAMGRQAFNGVPGFLHHVFDKSTLSNINNQAQNFVVYDVSQAAADALRKHAGFAHYNRVNRRVWELSLPFQIRGLRWFKRLLVENDGRLIARLTASEKQLLKQMKDLLADPFYAGFQLHGHAHGVKPIGFFVVHMLDKNPRTPYRLELALHNLHTEIYRRYVRDRLEMCRSKRSGSTSSAETGPLGERHD